MAKRTSTTKSRKSTKTAKKGASKSKATPKRAAKSKKKAPAKKKSRAKKSATGKSTAEKPATEKPTTGDVEVKIDRRRASRREEQEPQSEPQTEALADVQAETESAAPTVTLERRKKVNRRRQIDPTTCERDYNDNEVEFMNAMDEYKRANGRMFPTCSEVLEVIRGLGYAKLTPAELSARQPTLEEAQASFAADDSNADDDMAHEELLHEDEPAELVGVGSDF